MEGITFEGISDTIGNYAEYIAKITEEKVFL